MSNSLGGTNRNGANVQLEGNSRRQGSGRVVSAIALTVAIITLIIVLLLRMWASPENAVTPPVCEPGMSAYEVWLSIGNEGSVEDFLAALVGEPGADGYVGADGFGGQDGASAYQLWLDAGNTGTPQQFLDSLIGATGLTGPAGIAGISAYQLWLAQGNTGTQADFLASLVGEAGQAGADGQEGSAGQSAYELWLLQPGNAGKSEVEFLASLIGPIGPPGECTVGDTGPQGPAGADGADGLSAFEVWLESNPGGTIEEFFEFITGPQGPQGIQGIQGEIGATGPQGPPGGFGAYGSFYDTTDVALPANSAIPAPLDTTVFASGVSIVDGYKITMAAAGKYNIAFSSQLLNSAGQRRNITIWLTKNGIAQSHWVPESTTDIVLGTAVQDEKNVAAWNFFVDAQAGDFFALMIVASGSQVTLNGGSSLNTTPAGIPQIPATILTVNQVG